MMPTTAVVGATLVITGAAVVAGGWVVTLGAVPPLGAQADASSDHPQMRQMTQIFVHKEA